MDAADKIDCPECYGSGWLECSRGCPGGDSRCVSCHGKPAKRCRCDEGLIAKPVICGLCDEDEGELRLAESHRTLDDASLGWWVGRGRLALEDCKRGFCEDCAASVGLGEVGP